MGKNRKSGKKGLGMHLTDVSYLGAAAVIVIITVLLFLDRAVFRRTLPLVFACGAYLAWISRKRLKGRGRTEKWSAALRLFYDMVILILGIFALVSCLTNWTSI